MTRRLTNMISLLASFQQIKISFLRNCLMKTNKRILWSSILAAITAFIHTVGGTIKVHTPLFNSNLSNSVSVLLYVCWHLVSVSLILSACSIYWLAQNNRASTNYALGIFISSLWILFGLMFLLIATCINGVVGLIQFPQWVLLLPIGALLLSGLRQHKH